MLIIFHTAARVGPAADSFFIWKDGPHLFEFLANNEYSWRSD